MKEDNKKISNEFLRDKNRLLGYFISIRDRGWIKSMRNGTTGIGYTFETLINKSEDNKPIPDFGTIEIKAKHRWSKGTLGLFCTFPDGDMKQSMRGLWYRYGYYKDNIKKLIANVYSYSSPYGLFKKIKIDFDDDNQKIYLLMMDNNENKLDRTVSFSYKLLEEKMKKKLQYLAIVRADNKYEFGEEYFHYYDIKFYKYKGFETFLSLLKNGKIRITINSHSLDELSGYSYYRDEGSEFVINLNDVELLFDLIY